jgi:hypothetical protein
VDDSGLVLKIDGKLTLELLGASQGAAAGPVGAPPTVALVVELLGAGQEAAPGPTVALVVELLGARPGGRSDLWAAPPPSPWWSSCSVPARSQWTAPPVAWWSS